MFDSHVHTNFSCDSDMRIEDGIASAREKGLGIVITDHMDINPFRGDDFTFDVPAFFEANSKLRNQDVLLGIEVGLRIEAVQANRDLTETHDFDFVLASTHAPYDMETSYEYYDKAYYEGLTKKQAYAEYFDSMLRGIQQNLNFDSLAHIDYIARYSPFEDSEVYYDEFSAEIDLVLRELADQGKSMEISTRRLGLAGAETELRKIYKRFAQLGGRTVTIGSDSHDAGSIGNGFDKALGIAKDAGLVPVYYRQRKMMVMAL